jgi:hypothetical protein
MGIEKTTWAIIVGVAMLTAFVLFINDIQQNYNIDEQTNYSNEVQEFTNVSTTKLVDFSGQIDKQIDETTTIGFIGEIPATLLGIVRLFLVTIPSIAISGIALGISSVTGIEGVVGTFLIIAVMIVMGIGFFRFLTGKGGEI